MAIAEILEKLYSASEKEIKEIALEYGKRTAIAKNEKLSNPHQYRKTVEKILSQPEKAQAGNLFRLMQVLGLDAEAAIAIAASQIKN